MLIVVPFSDRDSPAHRFRLLSHRLKQQEKLGEDTFVHFDHIDQLVVFPERVERHRPGLLATRRALDYHSCCLQMLLLILILIVGLIFVVVDN